jgi:hypothetical protein
MDLILLVSFVSLTPHAHILFDPLLRLWGTLVEQVLLTLPEHIRVIYCSKSKDRQNIGQQKKNKKNQQAIVDKPIHRKLKIKQHEHY